MEATYCSLKYHSFPLASNTLYQTTRFFYTCKSSERFLWKFLTRKNSKLSGAFSVGAINSCEEFVRNSGFVAMQDNKISATGDMPPKSSSNKISAVILDLDGTLLNTERVAIDVIKELLEKHGVQWDGREGHELVGKTPFEASATIVAHYQLPISTEDFISEITPMFHNKWRTMKPLPGANRLIKHLVCKNIPLALASNSSKADIITKISHQLGWKDSFSVIIGGDEVKNGKPSPEIFLEAAKRLNEDPSNCVVIEDSLAGVGAGKAAGMQVIAVPSIPKRTELYMQANEVINSLFDLHLENLNLPPFEDWVEKTLPLEPWYIGGPVIKGFGRGSKMLGIPTANLSTQGYSGTLSEHPSGVYFGWAGLAKKGVFKMVMSVGWNPYFNNAEKTVEPWLLHHFEEDFYGEELRLAIVGYIRPEANFSSLESLIDKIHEDGKIAARALDLPSYSRYRNDSYIV